MPNKKILILTTGGTIAGSGKDSLQSSSYTAGTISGSSLLASLPFKQDNLSVQEIAQIDSIEMNVKIWKKLLETLEREILNYDGFVITHGTDTMEESSFVLDLLYKGKKPVVFVGAMRPSNAIGSDGVKNLCNAIALALDSRAQGVMVLMNDKIYSPKTIYKAHTYNLDAFSSGNGGEMGYVLDSYVKFFYQDLSVALPFETQDLQSLPRVEIAYIYAGIQSLPFWNHPLDGLVVAGCGAGNIPKHIKEELMILQKRGVQIVTCSRGSQGLVLESEFIPSFGLNLAKARILLALCLQHFQDKQSIQELFSLF